MLGFCIAKSAAAKKWNIFSSSLEGQARAKSEISALAKDENELISKQDFFREMQILRKGNIVNKTNIINLASRQGYISILEWFRRKDKSETSLRENEFIYDENAINWG